MSPSKTKRLTINTLFGFSSGLSLALLGSTVQAWFADVGASIYITGMLSLLGIPYIYKILWTPFLDRYSILFAIGKRKSWILLMQILLGIGFILMSCLSPVSSQSLMIILIFILANLAATQDSAIDAYRIESLPANEYGIGASLASFGYRVAGLVSGGIALIIAQYYGWVVLYRIMGLLMLLSIIITLFSDEPVAHEVKSEKISTTFMEPFKNLISKPSFGVFCLFVIFYKLGEAFTTTTSGIVMPFLIQGLGFSLETIGYVNKILGFFAVISGGLIAGFILLRTSLYRALFIFGLIQALTNALFVILAMVGKNIILFGFAVVCDNFAAGMGTTALAASLMRFVDIKFPATQFSLLVAFGTLPRVFSGPIGAFLQANFGWVGLYQIALLLSFGFIPFLFILSGYKFRIFKRYTND